MKPRAIERSLKDAWMMWSSPITSYSNRSWAPLLNRATVIWSRPWNVSTTSKGQLLKWWRTMPKSHERPWNSWNSGLIPGIKNWPLLGPLITRSYRRWRVNSFQRLRVSVKSVSTDARRWRSCWEAKTNCWVRSEGKSRDRLRSLSKQGLLRRTAIIRSSKQRSERFSRSKLLYQVSNINLLTRALDTQEELQSTQNQLAEA